MVKRKGNVPMWTRMTTCAQQPKLCGTDVARVKKYSIVYKWYKRDIKLFDISVDLSTKLIKYSDSQPIS